jgi:hypothetical protein
MFAAERRQDGPEVRRLRRKLCNMKSELRRKMASAKRRACREFLASRLDLEGKEIVFCEHVVMREALLEECEDKGVRCVQINGDTAVHLRQNLVKELSHEETACKVGVFSIMAAGSGLNCTPGVRRVTFAELCWNPSDADQCEDRVHRFGTVHPVEIVYVVARGTVEESIVQSHQQKSRDVNDLLDGGALPDRGFDSPTIITLIGWGVDPQIARALNPPTLPRTMDEWIFSLTQTKPPAQKTHVKCRDLQSDAFVDWIDSDACWCAETDTEFVAFQLKEDEDGPSEEAEGGEGGQGMEGGVDDAAAHSVQPETS